MSLKAKVEAIIYAAEEPITVEQIAQLLRDQILADEARREAEAQAAAEAKAAEEAQNAAEAQNTVAESAASAEATESSTTEDNAPTISVGENDGAPVEVSQESGDESATDSESPESVEAADASTPVADESSPVETAETPVAGNEPPADIVAEQTAPEATAEVEPTLSEPTTEEPAPAESASVEAPAAPGKRQKKTKEELAVDAKVRARVRALIADLIADYANEDRGIEVRQVAGGYRMSTKPEHHDVVRAFAKSLKPPVRLSLAALETLAVIAYKQPITVPEISEIRGVESGGVIATLLDRKLITTAGRKQVIGRPILYKTAKEFLLRFGLNDVSELPSMEEFEKLAAEGLGIAEEQTSLDLQAPAPGTSSADAPQSDEATTPLKPEEGLNGAPAAERAPAEETSEITESVVEETEAASAEETQSGTKTEEPQHS